MSIGPVAPGWPASGAEPCGWPASPGSCPGRALDEWQAHASTMPAAAAVHDLMVEPPGYVRCKCRDSSPPEVPRTAISVNISCSQILPTLRGAYESRPGDRERAHAGARLSFPRPVHGGRAGQALATLPFPPARAAARREQPIRRRRKSCRARAEALLRRRIFRTSPRRRQRRRRDRARSPRRSGQGQLRGLPRPGRRFPRRSVAGKADLARRGMEPPAHSLAPRRRAGAPSHVGRSSRLAAFTAVRPDRESRRDERLAPLCGRADLLPLPRGVRGDLRTAAAARRLLALPAARRAKRRMRPADPRHSHLPRKAG